MTGCERLTKCPIVNDSTGGAASTSEKIKQSYCNTNYSECARYMVLHAVGGDFIPNGLQPHEAAKAEVIIEECKEFL